MGVINNLLKSNAKSTSSYFAIFDGLVSSQYSSNTSNNQNQSEFANITDSETIINIHKEFIQAGAQAIRTNTLNVNQYTLKSSRQMVNGIIARGYLNAKKAVLESKKLVDVFACIGQLPTNSKINFFNEYSHIVDVFEKCGATAYSFENFTETKYLLQIAHYIKSSNKNSFIMVHFEVTPEGYTSKGLSGIDLVNQLQGISLIDMFGFSCSTGPQHLFKFISSLGNLKNPISCMSNVGLPDNTHSYFCSPEYFGEKLFELTKLGVKAIGGLNGATPLHISHISKNIQAKSNALMPKNRCSDYVDENVYSIQNKFLDKESTSKKIIIVELSKTTNYNDIVVECNKYAKAGADILSFSDSFHGSTGIDSAFISAKIKRETSLETMPHIISKLRNPNSIRSTILGLHMEEIRNIFAISGEGKVSEQKHATTFTSIEILEYINQMNKTTLYRDPIICSAAFNPNISDIEGELERAKQKLNLGVKNFITPPVFCGWAFENIIKARKYLKGANIIGGILPITSYDNALYLRNEIPSITFSNNFVEAYKNLSVEDANTLGFQNSINFAKILEHSCDGFFFFSSSEKVDLTCNIISEIKAIF